jgi:hypothetical protein
VPASTEGAPFPAGYRHWTVVKGRLVSAASPSFAKGGGFRYIYANRIERNADGHGFADGTILVDERVEATADDAGVFQEGRTIHVGVMVKDSSRCAGTGGWCFNFFTGSDRTAGIPSEAQKACFTQCHSRRAETDFVFSTFRNP